MNVLNMFEDRVGAIFGASSQGYTAPFSFKKLAKKAAHEMENETYVINGVDTAPALYTVLISQADDQLMRPMYPQITSECAQLIEAQAQKRGYTFVGEPLVRFVADPTLRSGKFSVFAENVDARTLARLRDEERSFMGERPQKPARFKQEPSPRPTNEPRTVLAPQPQPRYSSELSEAEMGLERIPDDVADQIGTHIEVAPMTPIIPVASSEAVAPVAAVSNSPRPVALVSPEQNAAHVSGAHAKHAAGPVQDATCMLIDRQSGRTYTASAPSCIMGRERTSRGIVLRDPNVSRRHAELSFDGRDWRITDLNSTNGTLVNDVDIDECILRDGDLITVGLVNLEFREA